VASILVRVLASSLGSASRRRAGYLVSLGRAFPSLKRCFEYYFTTMRVSNPLDRRLTRGLPKERGAARALGAFALGAAAIGALAVGALAIARLAIGRARIGRLEIDELLVRRLRVIEELQVPPNNDLEK
jgi:hypothetical protein